MCAPGWGQRGRRPSAHPLRFRLPLKQARPPPSPRALPIPRPPPAPRLRFAPSAAPVGMSVGRCPRRGAASPFRAKGRGRAGGQGQVPRGAAWPQGSDFAGRWAVGVQRPENGRRRGWPVRCARWPAAGGRPRGGQGTSALQGPEQGPSPPPPAPPVPASREPQAGPPPSQPLASRRPASPSGWSGRQGTWSPWCSEARCWRWGPGRGGRGGEGLPPGPRVGEVSPLSGPLWARLAPVLFN